MYQFISLLHKDFITRKRHYIITSCELILPVLFACIPLVLLLVYSKRSEVLIINQTFDEYYNLLDDTLWPQLRSAKQNLEDSFEISSEFLVKNSTVHLFYAPENLITTNLIEKATKLFEARAHFDQLSFRGFSNEKELETVSVIYSAQPVKVIGTIFNNIKEELPDSLNYTIRCRDMKDVNTFKTDEIHKYQERISNPYKETLFLGWQTALEQTFIHLRTGEDNDFKVFLKMFPGKYKRYSSTMMHLLDLWPLLFSVGFLIFASILTYRITLEKATGMQALMSSMGLSQSTYWISSFTSYFLPAIMMSFIISLIYKYPLSEGLFVFRKSDFSILWLLILVFISNMILFCFVVTIFFDNPRYAVIFLLMLYMVTFTLLYILYGYEASYAFINLEYGLKLFLCIVPMSSIFYSIQLLFFFETGGIGIKWFTIMNYRSEMHYHLSFVIFGNIISFCTLIILLWYLDAVWPFQGRVSQPIYFPFTVSYWFGSLSPVKKTAYEDLNLDSEFYEPHLNTVEPAIVMQNVTKWYDLIWSSSTVIDKLSFKIYPNQITLLLGRRYCGKTTLFSILSGLSKPSHGKVFINGLDLYSSLSKVRKDMGVCPENFIYYEALTVHEHFQIFAGLKGVELKKIEEQVSATEQLLLLNDYRDNLPNELSDECKRKLTLGLAIIGNSKILLLDEPTKCLSSTARYHFWCVLQRLKRNHTIFLTSSSTNDIYSFPDRIALFSYGQLLSYGSLDFLKEKLDVGYKLHITKNSALKVDGILRVIQEYYTEAALEKETDDFAVISFKSVINIRLSHLIEELESIKKETGMKSFGIMMIPLEDAFLNESYITFLKNKDSDLQTVSNENFNNTDVCILQRYSNSPWSLHISRLYALFFKRAHYLFRLWGLFVLNICIPFILLSICFILFQQYLLYEFSPLYLNLNEVYGKSTFGFIETYPNSTAFSKSVIQNELLTVMEENSVSVYTHSDIKTLIRLYRYTFYPHYSLGFLVGGSVRRGRSGPQFIAWYSSEHYHTSPIALNLIHTAILRHFTGNGTICLTNHPLPLNYITPSEYTNKSHSIIILTFIPLVSACIGASYAFIPICEKTSKAKLLQLMSGLSVNLYWLSMLLWDILMHAGVCFFLILSTFLFHTYYFQGPGSFGSMYLIFFAFGWCAIPISYLMSLAFDRPINALVFLFLFYAVSGLISVLVHVPKIAIPAAVSSIFYIFPSFAVADGFYEIYFDALNSSFCYGIHNEILHNICDKNSSSTKTSPFFECCNKLMGDEYEGHRDFIFFHLKWEILIMVVVGALLLLLLKLLESARYQLYKGCVYQKSINRELSGKLADMMLNGVYTEKERIEDAIASGNHDESLMVLDLTKWYGNLCAVNNLTFGVNVGESLGIVGGHGAGKSTLLKMISGEINPSAGNSFVKEHNLVNNLKKFQSDVGYYPQDDALLNHLTGREMLWFICKLRGVVVEDLLPILMEIIEIKDFADELIKYYSFANKRRLAVVTAAVGPPPVLIFDEPTTGIDFKSKKLIWNFLSKIKSCNFSAFIFSSTSILECQILNKMGFCTRLAIIDHGTFQSLGPIEKLEEKYNSGKVVRVILKQECLDLTSIFQTKGFFESTIPKSTLLTYRQGTFAYHVGKSFLTLSKLFDLMDLMKVKYNLQDYLINDSSLSEVCHCYTEEIQGNYV